MTRTLTLCLVAALSAYLIGAFVAADFNIAQWAPEWRGATAAIAVMALLLMLIRDELK